MILYLLIYFIDFDKLLGSGDWGLGIGVWGLGPIPNPQSPIPNPQSPRIFNIYIIKFIYRKSFKKIFPFFI